METTSLSNALVHFLVAYRHSHEPRSFYQGSMQVKHVTNKKNYTQSPRERIDVKELFCITPFTEIIDYLGHTMLIPENDHLAQQFASIRRIHFDIDVKFKSDVLSPADTERLQSLVITIAPALMQIEGMTFLLVASRSGIHVWTNPVISTNQTRAIKLCKSIQTSIDSALRPFDQSLSCDSHRATLQERSINGELKDSTLAIPCSIHRSFTQDKRSIGYTPFLVLSSKIWDPSALEPIICDLIQVHTSCNLSLRQEFACKVLHSFFKSGGDMLFDIV